MIKKGRSWYNPDIINGRKQLPLLGWENKRERVGYRVVGTDHRNWSSCQEHTYLVLRSLKDHSTVDDRPKIWYSKQQGSRAGGGKSSESHAMALASSDKGSWKLCSRAGVMLTEAADRKFVSSPKFWSHWSVRIIGAGSRQSSKLRITEQTLGKKPQG